VDRLVFLSQLADVSTLPTEFRIFTAGENDSTQGVVMFDEEAAREVMANYAAHGVDKMIDLEHRSLDWNEPDTDARGWCQLELRNGELWAVKVSWTPDGEARLKARTQRYTSPAFYCNYVFPEGESDPAAGFERVARLINVALCSMPASYGLDALVASEQAGASPRLDNRPGRGYGRPSMAIAPAARNEIPAEPAPAAPAVAATPAVAPVIAEGTSIADDPAILAAFLEMTGAADLAGALVACQAKFSESAAAAMVRRRSAVQGLIALRAETPATAWDAAGAPVARLLSEPLADLEARVVALRAQAPAAPGILPPASGVDPAESNGLTAAERAHAETIKDPAIRARFIQYRQSQAANRPRS